MKKVKGPGFLSLLILALVFTGCAGKTTKFTLPEAKAISPEKYTNRVDNFILLVDASSSMGYTYNGKVKYDVATGIATYMNKTMPEMKINGAMKTFGHAPEVTSSNVMTTMQQSPYTKGALQAGIDKVKIAGGLSPVTDALAASYDDIKNYKGTTSIVVISDGEEMDSSSVKTPLDNLKALGTVCIYTIHVGDNAQGSRFLNGITRDYGCGFVVNADELASPDKMELFVKKVFLKEASAKVKPAPVAVEGDQDGDGVKDKSDACPDTPKGAKVNAKGCWVIGGLLFDTGKSDLKPAGKMQLDSIAKILKNNPDLNVEIQGHTDNVGSAESNRKLSEKRAESAMNYLVKTAGIEASRLASKGYGLTMPAASNDTAAGKAQNRRVQLNPVKK